MRVVAPRGSLKWLGMDRHGGPRIDTWYLSLANGAVYVYLDVDENGRYETHGYDATRNRHFEWVRIDNNGDGHADTWVWKSESSATLTYYGSNGSTATFTSRDAFATYGINTGFSRERHPTCPTAPQRLQISSVGSRRVLVDPSRSASIRPAEIGLLDGCTSSHEPVRCATGRCCVRSTIKSAESDIRDRVDRVSSNT